MSPEEQALAAVVAELDALGIPYMVTGSVASSHHGRPRSTNDVDIVINPGSEALTRFVNSLAGAGFYVDTERAEDALRRRRMFNVVHMQSASKVDLIVRKERPFSLEEFGRREPAEIAGGIRVSLASPEDTILAKLEWARKPGESRKQLEDVAGIVDVKGASLDREYIERWAAKLEVLYLWQRVLKGRDRPPPDRVSPNRGRKRRT